MEKPPQYESSFSPIILTNDEKDFQILSVYKYGTFDKLLKRLVPP